VKTDEVYVGISKNNVWKLQTRCQKSFLPYSTE